MQRFKLIPAVHLFLVKDGQILLLRRANTGYEDGSYSVPAGHLDGNEAATQGMAREAMEEAGVQVEAKDLDMVHVTHRKSMEERIDFFFSAIQWKGEPKICEPDKCDELTWFSLDQLPGNIIPYVKAAIENYRHKVFYSEFGW